MSRSIKPTCAKFHSLWNRQFARSRFKPIYARPGRTDEAVRATGILQLSSITLSKALSKM